MLRPTLASTIRLGAIALALISGCATLNAQGYPASYPPTGRVYERERPVSSPAERTIEDLRRVSQRETFSRGDHERYEHALQHLSEFSGKLYRGRFDRGKLDRSIDDLRNVLARNRMDPRARDVLSGDLNELYRFRSNYGGTGYRY